MNITDLERRYQRLLSDFQANRIDEARFIAEVDQLQFQDEWGRYWMIGAQSGGWYYYDGQTWHQADPRQAEQLPIIDPQGVYWQRGVKSGEWYYFNAERSEWVKPTHNEGPTPHNTQQTVIDATPVSPQPATNQPTHQPLPSQFDSQPFRNQPTTPNPTNNFDGELFQDEQGRYWTRGSKTGQWYFYDQNGWNPAPQPGGYQQPYSTDPYSAGQPIYSTAQPTYASNQPTYPSGQPTYPSAQPGYGVGQPTYPSGTAPSAYQQPQPPPVQVYVVSPNQDQQPPAADPVSPIQQEQPAPQPQPAPAPQPIQPAVTEVNETKPVVVEPKIEAVEIEPEVEPFRIPQEAVIPPRQAKAAPTEAASNDEKPAVIESSTTPIAASDTILPKEMHVPPRQPSKPVSAVTVEPDLTEIKIEKPQPASQQSPPAPNDGGWYYFDGATWLQHKDETETSGIVNEATGKASPALQPQPTSTPQPERSQTSSPRDVEVVAIVEIEPEQTESSRPSRIVTGPSRPSSSSASSPRAPQPQAAQETGWDTPHTPSPAASGVPRDDEVKPRRATQPVRAQRSYSGTPFDSQPGPVRRPRTASPNRPYTPRGRASERTMDMPQAGERSRVTSRPVPPINRGDVRRARENTIPMDGGAPLPPPVAQTGPSTATQVNRPITEPTQAMPRVAPTSPRSDTDQFQAAQATQQPQPTPKPISPAQTMAESVVEERESRFGEIFAALPGPAWVALVGLLVLLMFGVGIFGLGMFTNSNLIAGVQVTPTLEADVVINFTPTPATTSTATPAPPTATSDASLRFNGTQIGIAVAYPEGWQVNEEADLVVFGETEEALDIETVSGAVMWVGTDDATTDSTELMAALLDGFPLDAESLNRGSINIAGQVWTSEQIRYIDEEAEEDMVATLAVTGYEDFGYYLVALSPAGQWNSVQSTFQEMINSFQFIEPGSVPPQDDAEPADEEGPTATTVADAGADETGGDADETPTTTTTEDGTTESPVASASTRTPTPTATDKADDEAGEADDETTATPRATQTPRATATKRNTATPTPTPTDDVTPTPTPTPKPLIYEVEAGDTLGRIAGEFGVELDDLAAENGLDPDTAILNIGQELLIPFTKEELAAFNDEQTPTATRRTSTSRTATPDPDEAIDDEATPTINGEADSTATITRTLTPTRDSSSSETVKISGRIVYPAFNPGTGKYDLWLADLSTDEQVTIIGDASQPAFSRDGSLLAYRSWDIQSRGIIFRDFVSGRGGQVTQFVEDSLPSWGPDGTLVYASRKTGDRVSRLYRGDQAGNEYGLPFEGVYPTFTKGGEIVVRGCLSGGRACGLYLMSSEGGSERRVGNDQDTAPSISPTDGRITFMSAGRGGSNWEIWVMNGDGTDPVRLTENGNNDGLPVWSPDGKSIAYVSDQGGAWGIWVMNADGSNQRQLFTMKGSPDGQVIGDTGNSKGWLEERITWAP